MKENNSPRCIGDINQEQRFRCIFKADVSYHSLSISCRTERKNISSWLRNLVSPGLDARARRKRTKLKNKTPNAKKSKTNEGRRRTNGLKERKEESERERKRERK